MDIDGDDVDCQIIDDKDSSNKHLLFKPEIIIENGSLVTIGDDKWLIIDSDQKDIFPKAKIQKCNQIIKWQNSYGLIKQAYCIVTKSLLQLFDVNEAYKYNINTLEGSIYIYIQNNEDTNLIEAGDRFVLGKSVYSTTGIDDITFKNIIQILMAKDEQSNEKDDFTLGIADYIESSYLLSVINDNLVLQVDESKQLQMLLTNNNNIIADQTYIYTSSDTDVVTVNSNGLITGISIGSATITIKWSEDITISTTFSISVADLVNDNYSIVISGDSSTKILQSKIYSIKIYNNGMLDELKTVDWQLTNIDNSTPCSYASITSYDGTSCIIQADSTSNVSVKINAVLSDDETVIDSKNIEIKGLFG